MTLQRILTLAALLMPAALAGAALPADAAAQAAEGEISLAIGTQAPAAEVEDLDGNAVQLLDYVEAGKPTLLEFWATWCEQCEALQPQLDAIEAEHAADLNIVAVAVAVSQSVRRVRRHVEENGHGYPFLWDAGGAAVRAYRAPTTSVVVILDGEGKVAYTGVGRDQDLIGAVERVLAGG